MDNLEVIKLLIEGASNLGDTVTFSGIVTACLLFMFTFSSFLGVCLKLLKTLRDTFKDVSTNSEAIKVLQGQIAERDMRISALESQVGLRDARITELETKEAVLEKEVKRLTGAVLTLVEGKQGLAKQLKTVKAERDKLQALTPLGGVHRMLDETISEGGSLPLSDKKVKANKGSDNGKGASRYE